MFRYLAQEGEGEAGDEWMRQGERGERGVRGARSAVQTTIQEGARASENKIQNVSTPPDGDGICRESVGMPVCQKLMMIRE